KAAMPEPGTGIDHLSKAMRTLLKERLGPGMPAWAVGQADDWNQTVVKLLLLATPAPDRAALEKMRSFAAAVRPAPGPRVQAAFEAADATSAERLEKSLVPPAADRKPLRLLGTRPEAMDLGRELADSLRAEREGVWVTIQAKGRPESLRK